MKRTFPAAVLAAACLVFAATALAKDKVERPLTADSKALFDDQAAAIRQQMQPGGHYEFVSASEEHTVLRILPEAPPATRELAIGAPLLIAPRHVCATVNLWESFRVIGADGRIEGEQPVDGRNR